MTLLGGSPFYEGQKIAPLYMQSLVPRATAIIEFGAKGDNCAVAKYKTTKMAEKRSIFAENSISLALASLAAVFQCCEFLLSYILIEKRRVSPQSDSFPIPQKLTLLAGCPYLKCLHGKKLALPGGLPYQADKVTLPLRDPSSHVNQTGKYNRQGLPF